MNKIFSKIIMVLFVVIAQQSFAQKITSGGNWSNSANWQGGTIATSISQDVTMSNGIADTIRVDQSYTVGNITYGGSDMVKVESGTTFNVGNSTNAKNVTANNNAVLYVAGDMTIWGDLIVNNNLVLIVTGTLTIKGNVQLKNGGSLDVSGSMTVNGNLTADNNTSINVDGTMGVDGTLTAGNGSTLTGSGTVTAGNCSGPNSVCQSSTLPIELSSFSGDLENGAIHLKWTTLTEVNFSHFTVEHSVDGINFSPIGEVKGVGESKQQQNYSFIHAAPDYGYNYYRLKSLDNDGTFEYSAIIAVKNSIKSQLSVYPNPVKADGRFKLQLPDALMNGVQSVKLLDGSGKMIWAKGNASEMKDLAVPSGFAKGTYFLQVLYNNELITLKVMK